MQAPGSASVEETPGLAASPLQIGQVIAGKYRIERQIGRGGMGVVLAATQLQLERVVAIKVVRRDLLEDERALNRLLFEARSAARIRSEHVARVLDVGTLEGGSPFIVMEYLEGENLAELLDRQGALDVEPALAFLLQACEALAEVHASDMVHRDLKPGNLFIARLPDGSPTLKIVDFGISKHIGGSVRERAATTSPQVLGSPFYMAPEQMRSEAVDQRSDIWALGAILFEMLAARPPFVGETLPGVYAAVLGEAAPSLEQIRPGLPPGLDDVVQRCLAKDPGQRFCDVAELAEALVPFGRPEAAQRVERITRILTNPARASVAPSTIVSGSEPAAAGNAWHEAVSPHSVPLQPLSSPPLQFDAASLHGRAMSTPAGLGALSATGAPASSSPTARLSSSRWAWAVLVLAVAAVAGAAWFRAENSTRVREESLPGSAPAAIADEAGAKETAPRERVSGAKASTPAQPRLESASRALRGGPARSEPVAPTEKSVTEIRAALTGKAAGGPRRETAPAVRPAKLVTRSRTRDVDGKRPESSEARIETAEPAALVEDVELTKPPPSVPVRREAADPWDPESFGDRR